MIRKALTMIAVVLSGAVVFTQNQAYVPADQITRETLPATPLVYVAYGFVWVALMTYVFLLWRRIARVERELADVNAKLAGRR